MSSEDIIRSLTLDFDLPSTPTRSEGSSTQVLSEALAESVTENSGFLGARVLSEVDSEVGLDATQSDHVETAMSALEVAIAGESLKFIASTIVQDVLNDIWKGNVVLWGDLDVNASIARKKPSIYAWRRTFWAGYARLRVPRYRFAFQVLNFVILLILFLVTLKQPDRDHIYLEEVLLDIWFLGFAYAEFGTAPIAQLFSKAKFEILLCRSMLKIRGAFSISL
jgi:hypothetical protein